MKLLAARHLKITGTFWTTAEGWLDMNLSHGTFEFEIVYGLRETGPFEGTLAWTAEGPAQAELKMTRRR